MKQKKGRGWDKLNKYVQENFRFSLKYINKIRNYIFFSFLFFSIFGIIGFGFPIFFREQIIKLILELIKQTEGLGVLGLMRFIISNNMQSAFFGMIFGVFFGIFSLVILIVNGYILGFVANQVAGVSGGLVLWRLLPHGIFEIPAIMIAVGLGISLGIASIIFIFNFVLEYKKKCSLWILILLLILCPFLFLIVSYFISRNKKFNEQLNTKFISSLRVFVLIVIPLLVIAGIIESLLIFFFV